MKHLKKLAELVITILVATLVVMLLLIGFMGYQVDCTKNDNGTYSCSTEVVSDE